MKETGIITIQPGCSISTNEMRFTSENNIFDTDKQLLKPLFDISAISPELMFNITRTWNETPLRNFSLIPIESQNQEFAKLLNMIEDERDKMKTREELLKLLSEIQSPQDPLHVKVAYYSFGLLAITIFVIKCIYPLLSNSKK